MGKQTTLQYKRWVRQKTTVRKEGVEALDFRAAPLGSAVDAEQSRVSRIWTARKKRDHMDKSRASGKTHGWYCTLRVKAGEARVRAF